MDIPIDPGSIFTENACNGKSSRVGAALACPDAMHVSFQAAWSMEAEQNVSFIVAQEYDIPS